MGKSEEGRGARVNMVLTSPRPEGDELFLWHEDEVSRVVFQTYGGCRSTEICYARGIFDR